MANLPVRGPTSIATNLAGAADLARFSQNLENARQFNAKQQLQDEQFQTSLAETKRQFDAEQAFKEGANQRALDLAAAQRAQTMKNNADLHSAVTGAWQQALDSERKDFALDQTVKDQLYKANPGQEAQVDAYLADMRQNILKDSPTLWADQKDLAQLLSDSLGAQGYTNDQYATQVNRLFADWAPQGLTPDQIKDRNEFIAGDSSYVDATGAGKGSSGAGGNMPDTMDYLKLKADNAAFLEEFKPGSKGWLPDFGDQTVFRDDVEEISKTLETMGIDPVFAQTAITSLVRDGKVPKGLDFKNISKPGTEGYNVLVGTLEAQARQLQNQYQAQGTSGSSGSNVDPMAAVDADIALRSQIWKDSQSLGARAPSRMTPEQQREYLNNEAALKEFGLSMMQLQQAEAIQPGSSAQIVQQAVQEANERQNPVTDTGNDLIVSEEGADNDVFTQVLNDEQADRTRHEPEEPEIALQTALLNSQTNPNSSMLTSASQRANYSGHMQRLPSEDERFVNQFKLLSVFRTPSAEDIARYEKLTGEKYEVRKATPRRRTGQPNQSDRSQ